MKILKFRNDAQITSLYRKYLWAKYELTKKDALLQVEISKMTYSNLSLRHESELEALTELINSMSGETKKKYAKRSDEFKIACGKHKRLSGIIKESSMAWTKARENYENICAKQDKLELELKNIKVVFVNPDSVVLETPKSAPVLYVLPNPHEAVVSYFDDGIANFSLEEAPSSIAATEVTVTTEVTAENWFFRKIKSFFKKLKKM